MILRGPFQGGMFNPMTPLPAPLHTFPGHRGLQLCSPPPQAYKDTGIVAAPIPSHRGLPPLHLTQHLHLLPAFGESSMCPQMSPGRCAPGPPAVSHLDAPRPGARRPPPSTAAEEAAAVLPY